MTTHWISVDERLPQDDSAVLIYAAKAIGVGFHKGGKWYWDWFWDCSQEAYPTHWMPLPESPQFDIYDD